MDRTKVIIMGAAGRDFHNFNTFFRDNEQYQVVAFTATQIPNIDGRKYPAELSGKLYPKGIDIYPEDELPELIKKFEVDEVVFSYSDVPYDYVMNHSAAVNAAGADFKLLGPKRTLVKSSKPVIAVCAVRTGSGKSQTTRRVIELLQEAGKKVADGIEISPFSYGSLAHITGIEESKIKGYLDNLGKATLVNVQEDKIIIRGIEDLDDYLRYIALKEKFEKP